MLCNWRMYLLRLSAGFGLTLGGICHSSASEPVAAFGAPHWSEQVSYPAPRAEGSQDQRFWARGEYLLWWIKDAPLPNPLVTTGPVTTLGPGQRPGTLGIPGTAVLVGGEELDLGTFSGARFTVGGWVSSDQTLGLEGSYSFLGRQAVSQSLSQPGTPGSAPLSIPFFDLMRGTENSTGIAFPRDVNPFSGSFDLDLSSRLQSAELNAVFQGSNTGQLRIDWLMGFRYLSINEKLGFFTRSTNVPPAPPDVFTTTDEFRTENDFYGGQIGVRADVCLAHLSLQAGAKIALGTVHQSAQIQGVLVTNDFTNLGPLQSFPGGYLALNSNIGDHSRDRFAIVPEMNLSVGYQVTDWLRLTAGYSFLYVDSVARPGEQIDRVINVSQAPAYFNVPSTTIIGPALPTFLGADSSFWAHGASFGAEIRY